MMNYDKNAHMTAALQKIEELIRMEHPDKDVSLRYVRMDEEVLSQYSEWDIGYNRLVSGDEYVIIRYEDVDLYFVNVSGDSVLTAIYETMRVVHNKF